MKLLLDECLPKKLKHHLPGHECSTVPEAGWAGKKKNGELLFLAEQSGYKIFLTLDRGMEAKGWATPARRQTDNQGRIAAFDLQCTRLDSTAST